MYVCILFFTQTTSATLDLKVSPPLRAVETLDHPRLRGEVAADPVPDLDDLG